MAVNRNQNSPHIFQGDAGAPTGYKAVVAPAFSMATTIDDIKRHLLNMHRCGLWHQCLHADLLDGYHVADIFEALATELTIAALTSATPAAGDLFIFADISDSNANKQATLSAINAVLDHGTLAGLGDDDHTQYMLDAGTSVDNGIPTFNGTDGRTMQPTNVTIDDSDNVANVTSLGIGVTSTTHLLHVDAGASTGRIVLDANAGVERIFSFRTDNTARWALRVDGAEGGANAGADFAIRRYSDAGAFIDAPFSIVRSTGAATFAGTLTSGAFTTTGSISRNGLIDDKGQVRAYLSGGVLSVSATTWTKLQLDGETFDTNGWFDAATNYRYTPLAAGKYVVHARALTNVVFSTYADDAATNGLAIAVYKNGSAIKHGSAGGHYVIGDGASYVALTVDDVVDMNGSTDYLEIYVYSVAGCDFTNSDLETVATFERVD